MKKLFDRGIAKFENETQLQLAVNQLKVFKLRDSKYARLLPFDPTLERKIKTKQVMNEKLYDPNDFDY